MVVPAVDPAAGAPKAKPPVVKLDAAVPCVAVAFVDPKENEVALFAEPNAGNDGADVDGAPNPPVEPNVGGTFAVPPLTDETTDGAKGRNEPLAPKPDAGLPDVVVVVVAAPLG